MEKINFEDGQLVKKGYVEIDGTQYPTEEAQYDGSTPLSAFVLNKMQDNIEEAINNIDLTDYYNKEEVDNKVANIQALPTGGTTGQVLTKQSDTDGDASWQDSGDTLPIGSIVEYEGDTVPEGYVEVEDENVYSTEEVRIGTWINGKPLYRKVMELTPFTISSSEKYVQQIDISNLNIDMVTDLKGMLNSENYNWYMPGNYTPNGNLDTNYVTLRIIDTSIQVVMGIGHSSLGQFTGFVNIEYTKTTD